tara:strand:+ start:192 stop:698 length:507 start_codon:yes stop_codon:yes gene_type:complete
MKLYSLKQLIGGFLLVLLFIVLFVVNVTYKSPTLNIKMFLNPILISLSLCMLIYSFKLNELIKLKRAQLNKKDVFNLTSCPHGFTKNTEVTTIDNIDFNNKICRSDVHGEFYLDGDKELCGEGVINDELGCFNKYNLRSEKCAKIDKYFEERDRSILNNWIDYTNNCR